MDLKEEVEKGDFVKNIFFFFYCNTTLEKMLVGYSRLYLLICFE